MPRRPPRPAGEGVLVEDVRGVGRRVIPPVLQKSAVEDGRGHRRPVAGGVHLQQRRQETPRERDSADGEEDGADDEEARAAPAGQLGFVGDRLARPRLRVSPPPRAVEHAAADGREGQAEGDHPELRPAARLQHRRRRIGRVDPAGGVGPLGVAGQQRRRVGVIGGLFIGLAAPLPPAGVVAVGRGEGVAVLDDVDGTGRDDARHPVPPARGEVAHQRPAGEEGHHQARREEKAAEKGRRDPPAAPAAPPEVDRDARAHAAENTAPRHGRPAHAMWQGHLAAALRLSADGSLHLARAGCPRHGGPRPDERPRGRAGAGFMRNPPRVAALRDPCRPAKASRTCGTNLRLSR